MFVICFLLIVGIKRISGQQTQEFFQNLTILLQKLITFYYSTLDITRPIARSLQNGSFEALPRLLLKISNNAKIAFSRGTLREIQLKKISKNHASFK